MKIEITTKLKVVDRTSMCNGCFFYEMFNAGIKFTCPRLPDGTPCYEEGKRFVEDKS